MKKTRAALALAAVLAITSYSALQSPQVSAKVGEKIMNVGVKVEAKMSNLEVKRVTANGISTVLFEGGDRSKPTMVMVHGYSADKTVWLRFARYFTDDYHVVIPDMPGHGETGFEDHWPYDVPSQAKHVIALMDEMGVDKFHVTGNSMGGFIAATLAANHGDRIITSMPIDPAGVRSPIRSDMEEMFTQGRNPFLFDDREGFDEMYAMTMAKPPLLPDVALDAMAQDYIKRRPQLTTIHEQFAGNHMLDDRLHEIKVPFLVVWGAKDQILHVSATDKWVEGVPHAQSHVFDELGHMPMLEDAEATAKVVKQFLAGV